MNAISTSGKLLGVVAAAGLALTACGTTGGTTSSSGGSGSGGSTCGHYKLAFLGATTGPSGALGQHMAGGVRTALAAYNKKHADCKVGFESFDSQGDASKATPLATKIINDDSIIGLVGPGFSGESDATGAAFAQAGLPEISPSATNVTLSQKGWATFHRVVGSDSDQGAADAKYLLAHAKKIFVVDDSEDYGTGLAGYVKKGVGSSVVGTDSIQQGQTDFSGTVTKITGAGADAVFFGGYYPEAGLLAKQLRQAGWKGLFMSGDGSEDPQFVAIAGAQAAEGAVLSAPAGPPPADFASKYSAANSGAAAGLYSTQSYDAANIYLAGIDAGKTTRSEMNDFVGSYSGTGVIGPIKFDSKGDISSTTIYAYMVKNGKLDTNHPQPIK